MAARAIWKGNLRIGRLSLPVKLYSAVEDRTTHFHLLHDQDQVRVKQRMVSVASGEAVESADVQRGYEVEKGVFVLLADEELDALAPEASRDITISEFVPDSAITPPYYLRPYYLGPDGDDAGDYFALAAALQRAGRAGLAHWVMRGKEYAGALRAQGGHLVLVTLRNADELVLASELPRPTGRALDRKEQAMAGQLVAALTDDFDPAAYHDEYRTRLAELLDQKSKGVKLKLAKPPPPPKPPPESLMDVLAASVKAAEQRGERSAKPARASAVRREKRDAG